ncbi:terminase gpA endonuclease subunit [Xanthomonas euvesicatoria]|uniref:terminase gpA endonuclease subunit n=1 Tax=Xanthomonas euvesicatoria TaxID=456327 RepID=UPI0035584790
MRCRIRINPDPGALQPAYYKGLTVEFYDKESGYWIKPKGARNEPLDTAVYAIWASLAPAVKADVIRDSQWEVLESQYQPATKGLFDQDVSTFEQDLPSMQKSSRDTHETAVFNQARVNGFARDGWSF